MKSELDSMDGYSANGFGETRNCKYAHSDSVPYICSQRESISKKITMIERSAKETDELIGDYILSGVTDGKTFYDINSMKQIPCNRNEYYRLYRKFFRILSEYRQ